MSSETSGLALLASGIDAEVFEWGEGKVLRLTRAYDGGIGVAREVAAIIAAGEGGVPVPRLYGQVAIGKRAGLVLERLDPEDMLRRCGRAPWTVGAVGRVLGTVHARLHLVGVPSGLPSVAEIAAAELERSALPATCKADLRSVLAGLPDGDHLLHGDFNPANLLRREGTGQYVATDWSSAVKGHPAADIARTMVMIDRGSLPAGSRPMPGLLLSVGRRLLRASYLGGYRCELEVDMARVSRWEEIWRAIRESPPD